MQLSTFYIIFQSKLQWLQEEVQSQLDSQSKMKKSLDRSYTDLQDVLRINEADRTQYQHKLAKQDQTIAELKSNRQGKQLDGLFG